MIIGNSIVIHSGGGGAEVQGNKEFIERTVSYVYDSETTNIGYCAFKGCSFLRSVSFPNVEGIGGEAFNMCSNLTSVTFPKAKIVESGAFYECSSLSAVSLPAVTLLYGDVFTRCVRLVSLYLLGPSFCSLSNFGVGVFYMTPIGGYSDVAGRYGNIYVPASLYNVYVNDAMWSSFASRFISV